jgi:hypothetical protein
MELHYWLYSVNSLNKYNRTFSKAFADGRFYVLAVILKILV